MMKLLLFAMYVYGVKEDSQIVLKDNVLLIYTEINLKISCKSTNNNTEETLVIQPLQKSYFLEKYRFSSQIYFVTLPDKNEGELFYEIQDDDKNTLSTIKSFFVGYNKEDCDKQSYVLEQLKKDPPDDESLVDEASYTYINYNPKFSVICVISDSLDKKVQMDKNLELFNIRFFSSFNTQCIELLKVTYDTLKVIRKEDRSTQINYLKELVFRITYFYSSIVSYEELYGGLMYESDILNNLEDKSLFNKFISEYEILCKEKKSVCEGMAEIVKKYKKADKNRENDEFDVLSYKLVRFFSCLESDLNFFKRKVEYDERYLEIRNGKYSEILKSKNDESLDPRIIILRNNAKELSKAVYVRGLYEIIKFTREYSRNIITNKISGDFIEERLTRIKQESRVYYSLKSNLYCLFSDHPEEYYKYLSEDTKFKGITPGSILKLLEECRNELNECRNDSGTEDKYFRATSKSLLDDLGSLEDYWKEVRDNDRDVGLSTYEPTDNTREPEKVHEKEDVVWSKRIIFFLILFTTLSVIITGLIFVKLRE